LLPTRDRRFGFFRGFVDCDAHPDVRLELKIADTQDCRNPTAQILAPSRRFFTSNDPVLTPTVSARTSLAIRQHQRFSLRNAVWPNCVEALPSGRTHADLQQVRPAGGEAVVHPSAAV